MLHRWVNRVNYKLESILCRQIVNVGRKKLQNPKWDHFQTACLLCCSKAQHKPNIWSNLWPKFISESAPDSTEDINKDVIWAVIKSRFRAAAGSPNSGSGWSHCCDRIKKEVHATMDIRMCFCYFRTPHAFMRWT